MLNIGEGNRKNMDEYPTCKYHAFADFNSPLEAVEELYGWLKDNQNLFIYNVIVDHDAGGWGFVVHFGMKVRQD